MSASRNYYNKRETILSNVMRELLFLMMYVCLVMLIGCVNREYAYGLCDKDEATVCIEGRAYPDKNECQTYYECEDERMIRRFCGPGLVFDINLATCIVLNGSDFNCENRCKTGGVSLNDSTESEHQLLLRVLAKKSALKDDVDPCDKPRYCTAGTNTSNPDECSTYFLCDQGRWIVRNCSDGTIFDRDTMSCTYPSEATCEESCPLFTGSTSESITFQPGLCDQDNTSTCDYEAKYPDRSDCEWYYLCSEPSAPIFLHRYCGFGFVFDIKTNDCVTPTNSFNCDYRCATLPPPTTEITSPVVTSAATTEDLTRPPGYEDLTTSLLPSTPDGELTTGVPPSTPSPAGPLPPPDGTDVGLIVGVVVGVVVLIIIVIIIVVYFIKKHKKNNNDDFDPENDDGISLCHRVHLYFVSDPKQSTQKKYSPDDLNFVSKQCHLVSTNFYSNLDDTKPNLLPPFAPTTMAQCHELQNEFSYETDDSNLLKTTLNRHFEELEKAGNDFEEQTRLKQVQYTAVKIDTSQSTANHKTPTKIIESPPAVDGGRPAAKSDDVDHGLPNSSVHGQGQEEQDRDLPNGFPGRQVQPEDTKIKNEELLLEKRLGQEDL